MSHYQQEHRHNPPLPPPSATKFPPLSQQGQLRRVPSAGDIVFSSRQKASTGTSVGAFASPLTRLEAEGRSRSRANSNATSTSTTQTQSSFSHPALYNPSTNPNPPPVPAIDFNLFRTNSVYSIDSLASFNTTAQSETDYTSSTTSQDGDNDDGNESPSTPKASTATSSSKSYFEMAINQKSQHSPLSSRQISEESRNRGALTPTKSVPSSYPRANTNTTQSPSQSSVFQLQPVPNRSSNTTRVRDRTASNATAQTRDVPQPHHPEQMDLVPDWASVHGEQGSDWGDDESQFEWVDTDNAPEAVNGNGTDGEGSRSALSPSKRLSRLKAVVVGNGNEGQQRKLKKPLVFPRRAAPPPPPSAFGSNEPATSSESTLNASTNRSIAKAVSHPAMLVPKSRQTRPQPQPQPQNQYVLGPPIPQQSRTKPHTRPQMSARWTDESGPSSSGPPSHSYGQDIFAPPSAPFSRDRPKASPLMVPMKDDGGPSTPMSRRGDSRGSHMSFQSVAYSFYDLDGESSPSTPRADVELVFPHGKYVKVSASTLEREKELRERTVSEPTPATSRSVNGYGDGGRTPEDFVHAGIEARGRGDLAKSAWYFMKAAEGGSPTGRMYWGLSLRHGWGVARDDKHAFVELRQACDESLAEGGFNFHQSPGAVKLTALQKRTMAKDLSVGMFEVGNCFLEGVGVKKAPDVALAYLRFAANMGDLASQEQLGFVLSKGSNGIRKDMKEAAKWYRMAISQGSSNTFGLAWIWKGKEMTKYDNEPDLEKTNHD